MNRKDNHSQENLERILNEIDIEDYTDWYYSDEGQKIIKKLLEMRVDAALKERKEGEDF